MSSEKSISDESIGGSITLQADPRLTPPHRFRIQRKRSSHFSGWSCAFKEISKQFQFNYTYLVFGHTYLTSDLELGWGKIEIPTALRIYCETLHRRWLIDWLTDWCNCRDTQERVSCTPIHWDTSTAEWNALSKNRRESQEKGRRSAFPESSQTHR